MSSTEDKENTENTEDIGAKGNNVSPFIKDVIKGLIHVIILGFLGANFVYLTRVNLDMFFPTDVDNRPYTDENKEGRKLQSLCANTKLIEQRDSEFGQYGGGKIGKKNKMKGGSKNVGCGDFINMCESKIFENEYFKGMFDYGFPYTMESEEETFGGILTSWFANKVKYSYVWLRIVVKTIISFSSSFCEMMPEQAKDIVPFILGPFVILIILFISSIWFLPSLVSLFWNENSDWGLIFSIVGLFIGWTWIVPLFISFVQMFGLMFKLILLPLMMNFSELIKIMGNQWNTFYMKLIFFIICIRSAFKNLNLYVAIAMTIVFIINMIPPRGNKSENK